MKRINIVVSLVSMLALTSARQEPSVCALLTAAEIEAVTGAKTSPAVPGGNTQMRTCMWSVAANKGGMTLSAAAMPPGTISLAYISPTQKLALDQTKALVDKAVSRQR